MGYSVLRRAQHLNGPIAMSVRREFVLMSVVFFYKDAPAKPVPC